MKKSFWTPVFFALLLSVAACQDTSAGRDSDLQAAPKPPLVKIDPLADPAQDGLGEENGDDKTDAVSVTPNTPNTAEIAPTGLTAQTDVSLSVNVNLAKQEYESAGLGASVSPSKKRDSIQPSEAVQILLKSDVDEDDDS